jgi:hypothetical protein
VVNPGIQGEKIEEQGAVRIRGQRDQLALLGMGDLVVERDQIGCLTAKRRPVVNDLELDFATGIIDESHTSSPGTSIFAGA